MLVDKLVNDGVYSVIERKELDKIMAEQNFSNSDRADPASAAKIARILGVDAIIIGSITQFGRDDKSTSCRRRRRVGGVTGRFGIGGVKKSESHAVVQITARMIDTSTAEILASVRDKANPRATAPACWARAAAAVGAGGAGHRHEVQQLRHHDSGRGHQQGGDGPGRANWTPRRHRCPRRTVVIQVNGLVADASPDGTLIINVGSRAGVKVGDRWTSSTGARQCRIPATGKIAPHDRRPAWADHHHRSGRKLGIGQVHRRRQTAGQRHRDHREVGERHGSSRSARRSATTRSSGFWARAAWARCTRSAT